MKLIATRGIPGSGKTTWARTQETLRVNRDDIRRMIHGQAYFPKHEKLVSKIRNNAIMTILKDADVIVDETCVNKKTVNELRLLAKAMKADFEIKDFDVDVEECILRDSKRPDPVGEDVIRRMKRTLDESK